MSLPQYVRATNIRDKSEEPEQPPEPKPKGLYEGLAPATYGDQRDFSGTDLQPTGEDEDVEHFEPQM